MRLSARILSEVNSVNSYVYAPAAQFSEGDSGIIYLQLINDTLDLSVDGFVPAGRRFVPAVGSLLYVIMNSLDTAKKVTRTATQPFPGDGSIWSFSILPADPLRGTIDLSFILTQSSIITRGTLKAGMLISPQLQS